MHGHKIHYKEEREYIVSTSCNRRNKQHKHTEKQARTNTTQQHTHTHTHTHMHTQGYTLTNRQILQSNSPVNQKTK